MGKKSRSKGKVEEKTMVVCPKCGGKEFETYFNGIIVTSNVRRVKAPGEDTWLRYDVLAFGRDWGDSLICPIFTCTTCNAEVRL